MLMYMYTGGCLSYICRICDCTCTYTHTHTQITCQRCDRVSEREEEFLDIPVALSGRSGLEEALKEAYIEQETLEGANQYRCERCDQLVDAKRVCVSV